MVLPLETQRTETLDDVIEDAIEKARWNENGLRTRSIRFYDRDFDEYVDVDEDEHPVDLGKYEVELERMPRIAVATASPSRPIAATSAGRVSREVHQNEETPVKFYVKGLAGGKFTFKLHTRMEDLLHVHVADTVQTLKEKIAFCTLLRTSQIRLFSPKDREMRNEQELSEFQLASGSQIELAL